VDKDEILELRMSKEDSIDIMIATPRSAPHSLIYQGVASANISHQHTPFAPINNIIQQPNQKQHPEG
jgi:hypothetical protein